MTRDDNHTTYFLITVDTETYHLNGRLPPFGANLYGEYGSEELGIPKIMEISDRYGAKSTFFVDVYMHYHYGKEHVRELCQRIGAQGHDVQLHAHTSWLPEGHSQFLCDYSVARQIEILREGKDLIAEWVGRPPIAFRAGSYAANLDTIRALVQNGFLVDSSYFARRRSCQLSKELHNRFANRPFYIEGMLEIPVTTYWMLNGASYQKLSKLDFNACSLSELQDIVPKLVIGGLRFIVLFLHSFSFIRWNRDSSSYTPNYRAMARFEELLREIAREDNVRFCTMQEAATLVGSYADASEDFVPTLGISHLLSRAWQRIME